MSAKLFETDVKFLQRFLKVAGVYQGPVDGKWSAAVDTAETAFSDQYVAIRTELGTFDNRSESNIVTLLPATQRKARAFLNAAKTDTAFTYRILSGTRTYAEQDALFAIGRTVDLNRRPVTKARGGQSNHNFGIAWDVGIFKDGHYLTGDTASEDKVYVALGKHIMQAMTGLEWGGNWPSFPDKPHYQLAIGKTVSQTRVAFEAGTPFATVA
jgi:peptidoglycan L-alanyl-D-glutamate endopeptidase CwlK